MFSDRPVDCSLLCDYFTEIINKKLLIQLMSWFVHFWSLLFKKENKVKGN